MKDARGQRDRIAERALASLRDEGAAQPPADLAARAAARALGAPAPSAFEDLLTAVVAFVRPAAALGCAAALVLGVAHVSTRARGDDVGARGADVASGASLELVSADDALAAVLPFSVTTSSGGAG